MKPAATTNRGVGIKVVSTLEEVEALIGRPSKYCKEWIAQRYIERPLLVKGRKFDLRVLVLLVARPPEPQSQPQSQRPDVDAYMYREGYVRTSSTHFSMQRDSLKDRSMHLTNDAVQNKTSAYGAYEAGNKLTFAEFEDYLRTAHPDVPQSTIGVAESLIPALHAQIGTSVRAAATQGLVGPDNPVSRNRRYFELLGFDFMLDQDFKLWLIEVNSNPCMEFSCPFLEGMLPRMVEHLFQIAIDPFFPPPRGANPRLVAALAQAATDAGPNQFELVDLESNT